MHYQLLPNTDLKVSRIALGTMTFGEQNTEQEAHQQLDAAIANGINFIDTAEMYPVPPQAKTQGLTERYIGSWLKKHGNREQLVLASKAATRRSNVQDIRDHMSFTKAHLQQAVDDSLQRLQTDYLDLYQLHWPERQANYFGKLNFSYPEEEAFTPLLETLEALADLVKAGKIRHIGVSNETPWGMMKYLQLAEQHQLPAMVSIQNPYNLLNRTFEIGLAEICCREDVGLLAYSPLAFGMLTGKYLHGQWPEGARLTLYERFGRYRTSKAFAATEAYINVAAKHGLNPTHMALAFVNQQPFVTSNIIGATTLAQLSTNIASDELTLTSEVLADIEAVFNDFPNPCP